ncbi:transposase [Synechococcus sp. BA-132 BA5]|uniref:transposase n=1 Tax=Synechococcus sp. BA-132 BA5 TaxID=3110252 RepID=UPI003FCE82E3
MVIKRHRLAAAQIVAAISPNEAGHPNHAKITPVLGFSSAALAGWASNNLAAGCAVLSDGLACFRSVAAAGCTHVAIVTGGKHPNELPEFRTFNLLLGHQNTSLSGTFQAFNFDKQARGNLVGFCCRFNSRFVLARRLSGSPMRFAAVSPARSGPRGLRRLVGHQVRP